MNITNLHAEFGAQITDIDISDRLSAEQFDALDHAINQYSVLVLRDQTLDNDSQMAFSRRFGPLEEEHVSYYSTGEIRHIGVIGNVDANGQQLQNQARKVKSQTANNMWHSDSSFREIPALHSLLFAHEVPEQGGDTEFASARAGWARLTPETQSLLRDKIAIHDYIYSRTKVGQDAVSTGQRDYMRPVRQKLVRKNPRNGEYNFYVGSHVRSIEGMPDAQAEKLIAQLIDEATRAQSIYRHQWQNGDLVIWDNRCILHRGCGYDADRYRRRLHQTRVRGEGPTLAEI